MKNLISIIFSMIAYVTFAAPLSQTTFVAFDIETTGFDALKERIIEIAVVEFVNGEITRTQAWLIDPGQPIKNSHVHQITDEMVKGKPGFSVAYQAFSDFVGNHPLIAHNAPFDVRFIRSEIRRSHQHPISNPVINTLPLFRLWFPEESTFKLGQLAKNLNLPVSEEHRALADTQTLFTLFRHGLQSRSDYTMERLLSEARGTHHFDGSRR